MPPRLLGLWVAACLLATPLRALDGRVVSKNDGRPVADAEVAILGRAGSARTDADGRFRWTPDPVPPFEVLVVLPGGGYVRPILVRALPAGGLTLEVAPALEESVMVVAGSAPSVESAPGSGVTVLPSEDLRSRQPANVAQAVENVAGAATVSEGHAAAPAIRGLAGGRTLILIDGARVTAERRVGSSATFVDPASLEGVEIARGPGSVAYGSDAFGGVLQLRTRRAEPGTPLRGRFTGAAGVGAAQQRATLQVTRGFARGGVLVQGHARHFGNWTSPEGEVSNSGAEDRGVLVRFDHALGGGLFSVGWQSDLGRDVERPRNNSAVVRFFYPEENSHRLTLGWERASAGALDRLGATAFFGTYDVITDQDRFPTATAVRTVERADVGAKDFHVRVFGENALGRVKLEGGLDLNGRFDLEAHDIGIRYSTTGAVANVTDHLSTENARRTDVGVYVQAEAPAGPALVLTGGARVDRVTTRNLGGFFGDRSERNAAFSGFAAATAGSLGGFSATAQVARGFRDPTLSDRYFRGPTGRGFITGNPDLAPERSTQLDAALRYSAARWRVAVYGYHYRIDDLVERYQTETDFFFFRNRGRARIRGVEAEVQATLPWRLGLELTAHRLDGEALDDGAALDSIPVPTATARLRREFDGGYGWVRTGLFGRLDEPGPTEQRRPGFGLLDAGLGLHLGRRVEIDVLGRNLLDKAYLASPDGRAVLAAGISGLATLTLRF
jgi:outer membrane receptor protein involved in Fe transport